MSSLRLCGVLAKRSIITQSKNAPMIVPVLFRCRDLVAAPFQYQQYRGHKNFSHKPTPIPTITKLYHLFIGTGLIICALDWHWILGYEPGEQIGSLPKVDAEAKIKPDKEKVNALSNELKESSDEESSDSEGEEGEGAKKKRVKEKVGFRDRKASDSTNTRNTIQRMSRNAWT